MPLDQQSIVDHYTSTREADRLFSSHGELERARTQEILRRYLPPAPAAVLDVGGAAGAYAFWLARQGYEVHLVDLVEKHVAQAEAQSRGEAQTLASVRRADARDLPFAAASFDFVLLLGPLYHLPEREDRMRAVREALRVLRPGGCVAAAVISRFASVLDGVSRGFIDDPVFRGIVDEDLATGRHVNPTANLDYFTTAYFHYPEDLRAELEEAGFGEVELFAIEGPVWLARDFDRRWSDAKQQEYLMGLARRLERDRALMGVSAHLLGVGRASPRA